jgi:hypothetical protein
LARTGDVFPVDLSRAAQSQDATLVNVARLAGNQPFKLSLTSGNEQLILTESTLRPGEFRVSRVGVAGSKTVGKIFLSDRIESLAVSSDNGNVISPIPRHHGLNTSE